MKILKNISLALAAIVFSSCAIHVGMITGDASISTNNFKMIGMAKGTATTTKIFGLGGLGKDALVNDAKKDLLQNNPLKDGQALANLTLDFKNSYILFVNKQKVTIGADIVEFMEQIPQKPNTKIPDNNKPVEKKSVDKNPIDNKAVDNKSDTKIPDNNKPIEKKPVEKKSIENKAVDNKSDKEKSVDIKPDKISNTAQPIDNIPAPKVIKIDKDTIPKSVENPSPPSVPSFEPTIRYSAAAQIVTSSGERFSVEAGDYFIGTLSEKGNPENGKLYDKNGRQKHAILPRRNH